VSAVTVTRNEPAKGYIAYYEDDTEHQVTVGDAEIDALAEKEQRAAWDEGEKVRKAAAEEQGQGHRFEPRPFEGFTPPSHQSVREGFARLIATEKLGDAEWAHETKRPAKAGKKAE
jgi:hypothetical protein